MTLTRLGDQRFELGEGALWDRELGRLFWVDILGHRVFSLDPATGERTAHDVGEAVGTVVVTRNAQLLVALRHRIAVLEPHTGQLRTVVALESDRPDTRANDGKCDPAGRFWVGTMVEGPAHGSGALYCLDTSLALTPRHRGVTCSNGLVWTRDATRFYYIDTPRQRVDSFAYDVASGTLGEHRVALTIPPELGAPDGMTIDETDQLWIALWGGGAVIRVDPLAGRVTARVELPATNVTSCAFGGVHLDQLYVTTARVGCAPAQLASEPDAGGLFRIDVGARGVPTPRFAREL